MLYGLIGERLSHSYSVQIHRCIADYEYELCPLPPEELDAFLKKADFRGINVTIPYKKSVIPYLDEISPIAEKIGAVNTMVNKNGKLCGYNTDFNGICELIRRANIDLTDKKVLILGTGGTSATALAAAQALGAGRIIKVSREKKPDAVDYRQAASEHSDAQIIINTTPAGMYPNTNDCPIDLSLFKGLCGVVDVVYNPLKTRLVLNAQERGIPAQGGLYMLAAQAVYASALFRGVKPDAADIERAYRTVLYEKQSIALVGMPSCGKTTIGRLLSEMTGKPFADSDEVFSRKTGLCAAEYISRFGEEDFRNEESAVVAELTATGGKIIATGGGAVLRRENVDALRRNGRVVFIDTPLERLMPTADRPLSSTREALECRYRERYDVYTRSADIIVKNEGTANSAAEYILKELEK